MDLVEPVLHNAMAVLQLRFGSQRPDAEHPVLFGCFGQPCEPVKGSRVEHEWDGIEVLLLLLLFRARGVWTGGPHLVPVMQRALDSE